MRRPDGSGTSVGARAPLRRLALATIAHRPGPGIELYRRGRPGSSENEQGWDQRRRRGRPPPFALPEPPCQASFRPPPGTTRGLFRRALRGERFAGGVRWRGAARWLGRPHDSRAREGPRGTGDVVVGATPEWRAGRRGALFTTRAGPGRRGADGSLGGLALQGQALPEASGREGGMPGAGGRLGGARRQGGRAAHPEAAPRGWRVGGPRPLPAGAGSDRTALAFSR